jgi:hypothetical protein
MTAMSELSASAIAATYEFGRWETVTDVGGGSGALLAAILRAHPSLHGVLADAPTVVERSRRGEFLSGDLASRTRFETCDFFHAIPSGSRAFVMKNIVHDWNDAQACEILRNCRRAVPDGWRPVAHRVLPRRGQHACCWQDGRLGDADDHRWERADG